MSENEQQLTEAEEKVLFGLEERPVYVCGKKRNVKVLPKRPATKLASYVNGALTMIQQVREENEKAQKQNAQVKLGRIEEILGDAYTDALVMLGDHYAWSDVSRDLIETTMAVGQIKLAVMTQVELNREDDFLLHQWRLVSHLLFQTAELLRKLADGSPVSLSDLPSSGEPIPQS